MPFEDNYFDLVISINTIHNLYTFELMNSLKEIQRVGKKNKYICVESYRNEKEKPTYSIGRSLAKVSIHLMNGLGGLINQVMMEIILIYILNNEKN